MAAHESPRTTKLYDRTADVITLDEVERIVIRKRYISQLALCAMVASAGLSFPRSSAMPREGRQRRAPTRRCFFSETGDAAHESSCT
jgi:hypothetical protein